MVDNINGTESLGNHQINTAKNIQQLLNQRRIQQGDNPYKEYPLDKTDISQEALSLFTKDQELEFFKAMAKQEPDYESDKVARMKAQFEAGLYKMPSDDELADVLLGDADFKALMGF
jgi:anti-sigma28 factor (negative regulator of flagellin synthesis)